MQLTLIASPNITVNPGKGRPWKKMEVLYKNLDGKVMTKTLVSFKNPTVFKIFSEAKQGDVFEVESVQSEEADAEGRKYWEWKSAHAVGSYTGDVVVDATGAPAKQVTKMVVTEADRNRYIVRQSSLERAIETLNGSTIPFAVKEVTAVAEQYEAWVFRPVETAYPIKEVLSAPVVVESKPRGRPRKDATAAPERTKVIPAPEGTGFVDTSEVI